MSQEKATFAAGCFWGVEESFRTLPGVIQTAVGYTAGHTENPTYEDVCNKDTGHAEAVEVIFNPLEISYEELLNRFWNIHDPTTLNRQGPDLGSQYRSGIYFHTPEQEAQARESLQKNDASGRYPRPIVTEVLPASTFYKAEDYHQQYFLKRGVSHC